MFELIKEFNSDYANAVSAITPFVLAIISWIYYKMYTESKLQEGDAASMVGPVFWSLRERYKILAAHQYRAADDVSGYVHVGQNSRPDQWQKLIAIKKSWLFRYEIIPVDSATILTVVISRNGKEKWKTISFNK